VREGSINLTGLDVREQLRFRHGPFDVNRSISENNTNRLDQTEEAKMRREDYGQSPF